ncbi:MAG: (Fe-S)-binding protein [candidate division KSB1 bacterium]|nr:(Fe-S)-binding protein [candidate division KSB1 bacterium]MDZ7300640.1 (Fe-S)-binding protein [candidate division KSB1 bacterium]MDZ7309777.1 (Fe-S)-binding protein [candidate division KSB1 bacterium]
MPQTSPTVSLFIPCLVDQVYPEIGLAMAKVLRRLGVRLKYDPAQTCCGQPAFNAGYRDEALLVAIHFLKVFRDAEVVVAPSGSCVAMVRNFYPHLFAGHPQFEEARSLGQRIFEFSEFLVKRLGVVDVNATFNRKAGFHNSCHSYRELRLQEEPLTLLRHVRGLELVVPESDPVCCGFGGIFSIKFDAISAAMTRSRLETFEQLGVEAIISNDPGCVMQMRQEAKALRKPLEVWHVAEVLNAGQHR